MWVALLCLLATATEPNSAAGPEAEPPTDATLIYYNARLALREHRPLDATKLWLLRNAHENQVERVSSHDADFHSITWVALGDLGLCQDGHPRDKDGAGLWPLAMHNWVVRNRGRSPVRQRTRPFRALKVQRQQRYIGINDVLGSEELRSVAFFRGRCLEPRIALAATGGPVWLRLKNRYDAARLLKFLLERSADTLSDNVLGRGVIKARLFDVHLQLMALSAQEARRRARQQSRLGRAFGLGRPSAQIIRTDADPYAFSDSSAPARILRECPTWPIDDWMVMSPERRLFLFDRSRAYVGASDALDQLSLDILDALIARGDGEEVRKWIPRVGDTPERWRAVWAGARGEHLLGLDADSGFGERSVIALQRGVHQLQSGELDRALRSLSYAVQYANESASASEVRSLSLRWLSYVAAQFELTEWLLVTLQELLPLRDYSAILEDLMWSAAFRADAVSFERGLEHQVGRGALGRRVAMLHPLARGDEQAFTKNIEVGLRDTPGETLRLLNRFVQRLEREDSAVREAQRPTLVQLRKAIEPLADPTAQARQARRAAALQRRTLAILEGLGGLWPYGSVRDDARSLSPTGEVFAGSVRLAPSDAIPWPFRQMEVPAPSIFTPLDLEPVEWRDADDDWVFGWKIGG